MANLFDILTADYQIYLKYSLSGVRKKVNVLEIDLSRGETSITFVVSAEKKDFSNSDEAFTTLLQRHICHLEEWKDFADFGVQEIENITHHFLEDAYSGTEYKKCDALPTGIAFESLRLTHFRAIYFNSAEIDRDTCNAVNPLSNEAIVSCHTSEFKGLAEEYYIETNNHFVLLHWYTTA